MIRTPTLAPGHRAHFDGDAVIVDADADDDKSRLRCALARHLVVRDGALWLGDQCLTTYEFVTDPIAIDLLFGSDRERLHLEAAKPASALHAAWEQEEAAFRQRRHTALLYA